MPIPLLSDKTKDFRRECLSFRDIRGGFVSFDENFLLLMGQEYGILFSEQ